MKQLSKFITLSIQSIASILRIIIKNRIFKYKKLNRYLSSVEKQKLIRILGNGKSLESDINVLNDTEADYLVVNRHVLSPTYQQIQPKFYVVADHHFFDHPEGLNILKKINDDTRWEMILFIPYMRNLKAALQHFDNQNIKIQQFNLASFIGFKFIKKFLYKSNLSLPRVQNVISAALYIGICAKYQTIELYGVEHSWMRYLSVNKNNDVCLENPHFYKTEKPKVQTWKEIQHADAKLHEVLRMYAYMFEAYWELKEFAEYYNVNIINCTNNSFIDAFNRR